MTENKSTLDDRNKQTNKGANDGRLAPMNDEQREIATKGGKGEPVVTRDAGHEEPSEATTDDEQSNKGAHSDQTQQNIDDEINSRGGVIRRN